MIVGARRLVYQPLSKRSLRPTTLAHRPRTAQPRGPVFKMLRGLTVSALLIGSLWPSCSYGSSSKDVLGATSVRRDGTDKAAYIDAVVAKMSIADLGSLVPSCSHHRADYRISATAAYDLRKQYRGPSVRLWALWYSRRSQVLVLANIAQNMRCSIPQARQLE